MTINSVSVIHTHTHVRARTHMHTYIHKKMKKITNGKSNEAITYLTILFSF